MQSSSLNDVLGNRTQVNSEESKVEQPVIDPSELNDISKGEFKIESLRMKDAEKGKVLWESSNWDLNQNEEQKVEFPASMLGCKAIGREIVFYS